MRIEDDGDDWVGYGGKPAREGDRWRYYQPTRTWEDLTAAGIPVPPSSDRHEIWVERDSGLPNITVQQFMDDGHPGEDVNGLWCSVCRQGVNLAYQSPAEWSSACPYNQLLIRALLAIWPVAYAAGLAQRSDNE